MDEDLIIILGQWVPDWLFWIILLIILAGYALFVISEWHILKKAGEKGWKALIPFYSVFVSHHIIGMSHIWFIADIVLWVLETVFAFFDEIPLWLDLSFGIVTLLFTLISSVIHVNKLCNVFNKGVAFKIGTLLLSYVFLPILAFGKAEYHKPEEKEENKAQFDPVIISRNIRRLENNLITLGGGVFAFSIWTFLKFFINVIVSYDSLFPDSVDKNDSITTIVMIIVMGIIGAINTVMFLLYSFVGLSARSEGQGKKKRPVYLFFAGVLLVVGFLVVSAELMSLFYISENYFATIITFVIDSTSFALVLELLVSAIRLRKLKRLVYAGGGKT